MTTLEGYDQIINTCKDIFLKKVYDYGLSWKWLRPRSLTDQIFIKALRIRNIENGVKRIDDNICDEYIGIVNYCVIVLLQLFEKINLENIEEYYDKYIDIARDLMLAKNRDYGEAWKNMRTSSYTDFILCKVQRIKQIEDNNGKTLISEGFETNYFDILNYAVFALMKTNN